MSATPSSQPSPPEGREGGLFSKQWLVKCLTSVFFIGYCPVFPGTAGTLVGVVLYLGVRHSLWVQIFLIAFLFFLGARLCALAEQIYNQRDSRSIVLDEVLGFLITMVGMFDVSWFWLGTGFVLNRIFDICKPFPLRMLEKIPRGYGVMLDDVGAGIYSNLALRVLRAIF